MRAVGSLISLTCGLVLLLGSGELAALEVYQAESADEADVSLHVADVGTADCVIWLTDDSGAAENEEQVWAWQHSSDFAELSVFLTDAGAADHIIAFTDDETQASCDVDWSSYAR